jgi:hypothetical protein
MKAQVMTFRRMKKFTDYLFDSKDQSRKAALILKAILDPRLSRLSQKMPGSQEVNYKAIQRFLPSSDPIYACGSKEQRARNTMLHAPLWTRNTMLHAPCTMLLLHPGGSNRYPKASGEEDRNGQGVRL